MPNNVIPFDRYRTDWGPDFPRVRGETQVLMSSCCNEARFWVGVDGFHCWQCNQVVEEP